jgi:hypothetical protein
VAELIGARLVADCPAELLQSGQVTLSRQQQPSPTVVPDRAHLFAPVGRLDLGQVVEAEQELDPLARSARGVAGQTWDAREVGRFVQGQQQAWREHTALRPRTSCRLAQQRRDQGREERPAPFGFLRWRDQVERAGSCEQCIEVEL